MIKVPPRRGFEPLTFHCELVELGNEKRLVGQRLAALLAKMYTGMVIHYSRVDSFLTKGRLRLAGIPGRKVGAAGRPRRQQAADQPHRRLGGAARLRCLH